MGRFDVGDDQACQRRARRGRGESLAECDRGPGARRRELDDAKAVQRGGVVVQPPTQVFVVLLGSVDVGHGDDVDLELHVGLPDSRVGARGVCFGGAHIKLLVVLLARGRRCIGCGWSRNSSSAALTSSGCVQPMLCGPSSTATTVRSAISFSSRSRAAVASNGQDAVRGAVHDQRGHVDLGQIVAEVGQPGVDARVGGVRRGAGGDLEARPQGGVADALGREHVGVVEVGEEVVEVGVAVGDDRRLDALEHLAAATPLGLSSVCSRNGGMTPNSAALLTPAEP